MEGGGGRRGEGGGREEEEGGEREGGGGREGEGRDLLVCMDYKYIHKQRYYTKGFLVTFELPAQGSELAKDIDK